MVGVASSIKVRQLAVRALQQNGRYWRHSRHCSGLTPNGSVAIDPKRTNGRALMLAGFDA